MQNREECSWAAVGSANNIYGSEVVENILHSAAAFPTTTTDTGNNGSGMRAAGSTGVNTADNTGILEAVPGIIFLPYDSRTTAEHGNFIIVICSVFLLQRATRFIFFCINLYYSFIFLFLQLFFYQYYQKTTT